MPTFSYWTRTTSSSANADTLVVGSDAATQITFTTDDPGIGGVDDTGDLTLDANGGLNDPNTWVVIDGTTYSFTYDTVGNFPSPGDPNDNKVPPTLHGELVGVIRTSVGNFFFVLDGSGTQTLMDQIGNGNLRLQNEDLDPPPVYVCFCTGSRIGTPSGARAVETLVAGDMVVNDRGEPVQIIWTGSTRISLAEMRRNPNHAPIRIPAGAFGPLLPDADLLVSPQHRIVLGGFAVELLFCTERVLAAAKHLVGTFAEISAPQTDVEYFHILTEKHEIIVSNGLPTESFQPARRSIDVMGAEAREVLVKVLDVLGRNDMLTRKDALPSLKAYEIKTLVAMMQHRPPRKPDRSASASDLLH